MLLSSIHFLVFQNSFINPATFLEKCGLNINRREKQSLNRNQKFYGIYYHHQKPLELGVWKLVFMYLPLQNQKEISVPKLFSIAVTFVNSVSMVAVLLGAVSTLKDVEQQRTRKGEIRGTPQATRRVLMSLQSTISKNAATTSRKHELICFGSHVL